MIVKLSRRLRRTQKAYILTAVIFLSVPAGYEAWLTETSNFHAIVPGEAFRSAQMGPKQLEDTIKRYGIKTVINLRGTDENQDWYRSEIETCRQLNVLHIDRRFSAREEFTIEQMDELVALFKQVPKPILIHCRAGADRTGLASALYSLSLSGSPPDKAACELTLWYGHVSFLPIKEQAMDRSFWHYVEKRAQNTPQNKSSPVASLK